MTFQCQTGPSVGVCEIWPSMYATFQSPMSVRCERSFYGFSALFQLISSPNFV